jgi:ATP-dependent Clp protease ATP-binding subunit ClpA
MRGYNFTERVRKTLTLARVEAAALHHEYVGTEHILLGVLTEGEGIAATVLENLGIDLDELRATVLTTVQRGPASTMPGPDLPYTTRAKTVLELARQSAHELDHAYVGTEHLLLGLIREKSGIAARILVAYGATDERARADIIHILGTPATQTDTVPPDLHDAADAPATTRAYSTRHAPQYAERLRMVIAAAHDAAARRNSVTVTSADAIIALLEHGEGAANAALGSLSLNRVKALSALRQLAPAGTDPVGPKDVLKPGPDLEHVLRALAAPTERGFNFGTQHLLLLVLQKAPDVAAVFERQKVFYRDVRNAITRVTG